MSANHPHHECQCSQHDCREEVCCRRGRCPERDPHLCEFCADNADCNGSALNPSAAEDEHSFLGPKL